MNISFLPRDVQRKIFKYICSGTACIILDAIKNDKFKLQYVRVYKFVCLNYRNIKIWDELKPSSTKKMYYGDKNRLYRTKISTSEKKKI